MNPHVSVVIPTLNGGEQFRECMESLSSQNLDKGFETIVIDSASTDGTPDVARKHGAKLIEISRAEFNHGLTRDLGVKEARGRLIALLTQDAIPSSSDWLSNLTANFDDPEVAGAYCRQIPRDCKNPLIRARLKAWSASKEAREVKQIKDEAQFNALKPHEQIRLLSFDNVASMIRKSVWEKINFGANDFGEDTAWSFNALKAGHKTVYDPHASVYHSHNNSLWYEFRRVYMDHQNWNKLIDLKLFPRPTEIIPASINVIREHWGEINGEVDGFMARLYWKAYSIPYAFSQNTAQFLGPISNKWMLTRPWFKKVNEFLKKGI